MTHTITIDEEQRQLILLALAVLSLQRPGWDYVLRETAKRLPDERAEQMYQDFRDANKIDFQRQRQSD